ncbi:MAG: hypothetical protein OEZ54_06285 [Gemmatimonadota bacterium]|nr:hypothetical protein [Gemmatimonadota bacterium]
MEREVQKIPFASGIEIDGGRGDAGLFGDLVEAGCSVSDVGEDALGGPDDILEASGGFGSGQV